MFTIAVLLASCDYLPFGYTAIADIVAAPAQFEGREVKIKGRVSDATKIPLLESKLFVLKSGAAELAVVTQNALPAIDEEVAVRGTVQSAAIIGGQSIGLRVTELKRLPNL